MKKEFGKKRQTAKQLLTDALTGGKLPSKDYAQIKSFALNLEKIYKIAKETKREESFHLSETIYEIIRTKIPHLADKWAKKVAEAEDIFISSIYRIH